MNETGEYEVESITQARVEKKRGRGKNLVWKYCVRWKGYGPGDDTWEPVESFEGSEAIINRFWERANVGGRNYRDLSLFKAGEQFLLTGPPRRKERQKSPKSNVVLSRPVSPLPPTSQNPSENKRPVRERDDSLDGSEGGRPRKRIRSNASNRAPSHTSPLNEVKHIPLPRHSYTTPTHASIDQFSSLPAPSHIQQKKGFRSSSIDEIIPASDDEIDGLYETFPFSHLPQPQGSKTSSQTQHISRTPRSNVASGSSIALNTIMSEGEAIHNQNNPGRVDDPDPLFDAPEDQLINLPSHRARAANPLVKMMDDPNAAGMSGAISVKTRLAGHKTAISPTIPEKSRKPGPGRSSSGFIKNSLLTYQKGSLKTMKGSYKKDTDKLRSEKAAVDDRHNDELLKEKGETDCDEGPKLSNDRIEALPTADELLGLAGLDARHTETLSDFEEDVPLRAQVSPDDSQPPPPPQPDPAQLARQRSLASLAITKDKLLPSVTTTGVMNTPNTTWKRPTIFDVLGPGLGATASSAVATESSESLPFSLNLDSNVSIPVLLTHPLASVDPIAGKRGPPGKFYGMQAAIGLIDTLRTGGSFGKVVIDTNTTDDQRTHFERFCSRLDAGELFVAIAGMEVLAFCSSDNTLISQRLNISPSLLSQPREVLASQVIIENHSAYADAAVNADGREWSRYFLAVA